MKKTITVLSMALTLSGFAQINLANKNFCSQAKIKRGISNSVNTMLATPFMVNLENKYDLKFYHLNLNLSTANKNVSGNVRTLATVKSTTIDSFAFELYSTYVIDSVILNGVNT